MDGLLKNPTALIPYVAVGVIVLGILFAVVRSMMNRGKEAARARWVHGAYSLWTGGEDCAAWPAERAQTSLRDWYGAQGSPGFWKVINELKGGGQTGNVAWDDVRALDLLRIGLAATYIDAEQCMAEAAKIGSELQARFKSWEELGQAFEAGMHAWQRSRNVTDPQQTGRVQRNLPALREKIWPAVAYQTQLVTED